MKTGLANPTSSSRNSVAEGGAHESARQCRAILADATLTGIDAALAKMVANSRERPMHYYITNNMCDETKLPFGKHSSRKRRCLAWHGQATWSTDEGGVEDVDIIRPPRILGRYTAATLHNLMAQGSETAGLYPRGDALPSAELLASLTASDSHAVNLLLSKQLSAELPPNHLHICSLCMQHRTGSVLEEVSKKWGLLPPSFCLATQLQHGDFHDDLMKCVGLVLTKYLQVKDPADVDEMPPSSEEMEFANDLLSACYVSGLSDNSDRSSDEESHAESQRKAVAAKFLAFFPPPWAGVLVHACPAGCCGPTPCHDRSESVRVGQELIGQVVIRHLQRPAANRYTKIDPVVRCITLMLNFSGVFKKSMRRMLQNKTDNSDDDAVLINPNALIGVPADEIAHCRQLQSKQRQKVLHLVNDQDAPRIFLVWVTIAMLVMVLHYRLFKRGTWFSHMQGKREREQRFACFEFCRGAIANPAARLLTSFSEIIFDPDGSGKGHLKLLHGKICRASTDWPLAVSTLLHVSVVLSFARLWRLCVWFFKHYPWRLARMVDPAATPAEQLERMEEFLACPKGSKQLDPGFGRKLRERVDTIEDLQSPSCETSCSRSSSVW